MTYGQRATVAVVATVLLLCGGIAQGQPAQGMREALAVLQSDADTFAKARACQRLAAIGEPEAVPVLAGLLPDGKLSAYARSALEAIRAPAAGSALLEAVPELDGELLLGVVNSLGALGERRAVRPLERMARGANDDLAVAALAALGRIATPDAAEVLRWALREGPAERRPAAAGACLECADRVLCWGRTKEAVRLLEDVRQAEVPEYLRLAAACRAMVARQSAGVPMLVEHLRSGDRAAWAMTLRAAGEMPGGEVTQALVEELHSADPDLQVMIIQALSSRRDAAVGPALRSAIRSPDETVQLAALQAIGQLGDRRAARAVRQLAKEGSGEVRSGAVRALIALASSPAEDGLALLHEALQLAPGPGEVRAALQQIVGVGGANALPTVERYLDDENESVRQAAATAMALVAMRLAESGEAERGAELVSRASPRIGDWDVLMAAIRALRAASVGFDIAACQGFITQWSVLGPVGTREGLFEQDVVATDGPLDTAQAVQHGAEALPWRPWLSRTRSACSTSSRPSGGGTTPPRTPTPRSSRRRPGRCGSRSAATMTCTCGSMGSWCIATTRSGAARQTRTWLRRSWSRGRMRCWSRSSTPPAIGGSRSE